MYGEEEGRKSSIEKRGYREKQGKQYTWALGNFAPKMLKRALKNKKEPLKIVHRLQCKSLFKVADLVNGMWKVAPKKILCALREETAMITQRNGELRRNNY